MFKIESYVTPILLSYVDKYVRDFKPADAQVSLWGGGVALHNLVLKADVLQQEVALPFTLVSGRIHELLIHVPWTKIMSEPIVVTIDTIECVLSLNPPTPADETQPPEPQNRKTQVVEAPPGYMQALVRRIVSNIALRVHHLIVKYVQDDIVLSLNVKHLSVDSAGGNWEPAFADIDQNEPVIRRLVRLDDLTLCLDRADSDGKIRFYQEPLLYRCQLDLRVLTRLASANTRRATSLSIHLRSSKLAWGVTSDQLVLLLRLTRERPPVEDKPPPPAPKASLSQIQPLNVTSANSAEPARQESWSDWAWSWLPTWMDREGAVEEARSPAMPIPVHFIAYLDDVSLVFKVMELESGVRKRARGVLELSTTHAAIKSTTCSPTLAKIRIGLRTLSLTSKGKCVCGHLSVDASKGEPTTYLRECKAAGGEEAWAWPEEDLSDVKVELARAADEELRAAPYASANFSSTTSRQASQPVVQEADGAPPPDAPDAPEETDELWLKMAPAVYAELTHERAPPDKYTNPYESPPRDFEYSDWAEVCNMKVKLEPLELRVCMELLHRLTALQGIFTDLPPSNEPELPMRTLTVEECDSLLDNLPQRRIDIEATGLRVRLVPWDHSMTERPSEVPLTLDFEVPKAMFVVTGPLYPHRVCSAACQLPKDEGPLWNGARLHVSGSISSLQAQLSSPAVTQPRPCARTDFRFVLHTLLNQKYFRNKESVVVSYSVKIREANMCGSAARLQAAWHVLASLLHKSEAVHLKHTTLARDALADEESVAIELTFEELSLRGYLTENINTHILSMQSARATAYHAPNGGELQQAWIFSAPDAPTTTPYLRTAIQWCKKPIFNSLDYVGMWTEPISFSADPLFIAWLAYKPSLRPCPESQMQLPPMKTVSSTQYFLRRRSTPPSSSGKHTASRTGSGAELVHVRPRSVGSSSERRDDKQTQQTQTIPPVWWDGEALVKLHTRLRHMLVNVELGLVLLYVSSETASALDCATLRDAMERHAADLRPVLAASMGRLSLHSNSAKKHLWQEIRHDGPTFIAPQAPRPAQPPLSNLDVPSDHLRAEDDSFPWRMRLADVSCYTLEVGFRPEQSSRERMSGLKSQLKINHAAPKSMLELITTTVTISVVTRNLQYKMTTKHETKKNTETTTEEERMKYFTSGMEFKPSTLKEFFRGPANRRKSFDVREKETPVTETVTRTISGPVVSLGVHLHADTPPVILRLEHEQVHIVATALHGLQHIVTLLQRPPPKCPYSCGTQRTLNRSMSQLEEIPSPTEGTPSEHRSEQLISIFESRSSNTLKMKTFFWFQWVVSRATLVVATHNVKLAFDADDIIATVDLQSHYNQLKVKIASASVRHYERRGSTEWTAGVLGGRVLEAREPTDAKEENHFMSVTVTQAQISNLPENWKEELHPKLLEQKQDVDSMWEIYATLAPLEAVIQPTILENVVSLVHEFAPRSFCPLSTEVEQRPTNFQWPFVYMNAGGLRLLITSEDEGKDDDDTFMIIIGKVTVNPHPENPICRRAIGSNTDTTWMGGSGPFEGRQYEIIVKNFAVRSALFSQLVYQEASEKEVLQGTGGPTSGQNPALKWSQPIVSPIITSILHAVDIGCVIAPAMYVTGALACGPAVEFNLVSDCAVELSVAQLALLQRVLVDVMDALSVHRSPGLTYEEDEKCPYASLLMHRTGLEGGTSVLSNISYDETLTPGPEKLGAVPNTSAVAGADAAAVMTAAPSTSAVASTRAGAVSGMTVVPSTSAVAGAGAGAFSGMTADTRTTAVAGVTAVPSTSAIAGTSAVAGAGAVSGMTAVPSTSAVTGAGAGAGAGVLSGMTAVPSTNAIAGTSAVGGAGAIAGMTAVPSTSAGADAGAVASVDAGTSAGASAVAGTSGATDSGVETAASHSTFRLSHRHLDDHMFGVKKSVAIAYVDHTANASDYLEVFVTMGTIELSLYVADDSSPGIIALRPPSTAAPPQDAPAQVNIIFNKSEPEENKEAADSIGSRTRSLTETTRHAEAAKAVPDFKQTLQVRRCEGHLPLLHVTLHQPNLYYWCRKTQKSLQVSLFNVWLGLGVGQIEGHWNAPLLTTARGAPDPVTDIPPALLTVKATQPSGGSSVKGNIRIDIERPVQVEVCTDRLRRLKGIMELVHDKMSRIDDIDTPVVKLPFLYRLKRFMVNHSMESITIQSSQLSVCGAEGSVGCGGASLQLAAGARPQRVAARALLAALLVAAGPPADRRHVLLHPVTLGVNMEAVWEPWRRVEGGLTSCEPTVRLGIELDRVTVDLRPAELAAASRLRQTLLELSGNTGGPATTPVHSQDSLDKLKTGKSSQHSAINIGPKLSGVSVDAEPGDHFYKDDLRSGAFKMVSGGQLPMAYQVTLHGPAVAWRYPHPRVITRIVAFPLPEQDEEIECVLELYSPMQLRWHPYKYFKLPVVGPREIQLCASAPETVFAQMWRFRACVENEPTNPPFEFNIERFRPKSDPLLSEVQPVMEYPVGRVPVSAEQLSCAVRVDSYFAPHALPKLRVSARLASFELHAHNALPFLSSQVTSLEGYYVSRPLMRSHRVLTLQARDAAAHAHLGARAGYSALLAATVSSDILDCATGTMERFVDEFQLQGALAVRGGEARVRSCASPVHVALHVPRLRTLRALAADWHAAADQYLSSSASSVSVDAPTEKIHSKRELAAVTAAALDGRVSLWIHNSCGSALRIGQEGTDELVPLGPGATLAYRWRSPTAAKKLRLALAGPSTEWHWSSSIPFTAGSYRVRLEGAEELGSKASSGAGVYVHVRVEEAGGQRSMQLGGRLALANMLRYSLLYKVRARCPEAAQWRTVCSGELEPESVGRSVLAGGDCEMALKIKFTTHNTGWSGDIPLKECPKENVPWLVKVPSEGEVPYISVWCRVVRARSDGRLLATVWPLYVLHSHLPLDTDVVIKTEATQSMLEISEEKNSAPLVQSALGRGASTHLVAPGTTAARHELSFQYRNIDCPVTREAVPMHYGVTDTSVFDKRAPVNTIEEVVQEILAWLERCGRNVTTQWPYSLVAKHLPGEWQSALMQPRCDVTVRYQPVRAGGGCCLELQLCPLVLLCNAAPVPLTLRAHDAAPLCKLEPGAAIAPPSALIQKPFFMSVEIGRETFVSGQLQVSDAPAGRYSAPPAGHVTLDRACPFAIHCNQKVALLTMYYEIKQEINVLGVSTTFLLINRLGTDILVSAVAVPLDAGSEVELHPKTFKVVEPTKEGSIDGMPLCRFWLRGRWRSGGDPSELAPFLCVALPAGGYPASAPAPVRLGEPPLRRALALTDQNNRPVPIVVTQLKHDSRWIVCVARDPCPQFVVHNRSREPLALAQPQPQDEPAARTAVVKECAGARWWCSVAAGATTHYSSPAYCARYPPPPSGEVNTAALQFLALARDIEMGEHSWSAPVAIADGEQLVQLSGGHTVKLRVRTHPHSSLLELQDVDQNDISASEIRKRLLVPFLLREPLILKKKEELYQTSSVRNLQRTGGDEKLLGKGIVLEEAVESSLDVTEADAASLVVATELAGQSSGTQISVQMMPYLPPPTGSLQVIKDSVRVAADKDVEPETQGESAPTFPSRKLLASEMSFVFPEVAPPDWSDNAPWAPCERARCLVAALVVELAASAEARPLVALHVTRAACLVLAEPKRTKTTLSIAGIQIDNLQYESGQFDFGVVATTPTETTEPGEEERWPLLWSMLVDQEAFSVREDTARVLLQLQHETWTVHDYRYSEVTEVEISVGPLALYVEDAYVSALVALARLAGVGGAAAAAAGGEAAALCAELRALRAPLRLQALHVRPLDLTLTLHTAVRMYIALDQSPLRLSAFKLQHVCTSVERLTHALTVHYLSAAILGAGWVVGGLELLGAPGALAARVGGASGGVRGVASAAAAALVRSLSAWAGSLARNLDLLAGDEEHARRAAAARRRPPPSLVAGLMAGITNFAINILGAVGGLAHHPLVGVAVGESASGATALRRGLLGALTKPLSATADLVAYAGHGLLTQTGWDPVPQPRPSRWSGEGSVAAAVGWRRDSVRWTFRLAELTALAGFEVLLDGAPLQLLLTHKFLVVADPETEKIVEMIDLRYCSVGAYQGPIIELTVVQRRTSKIFESRVDEDDEYQLSAAAMARVARYTGAEGAGGGGGGGEERVLSLLPPPGASLALHSALAAAIHHNSGTHFPLL